MKNLPIIILVVVVALMFICMPDSERFSTGGLAISDDYCTKLADVYTGPGNNDPEARDEYRRRVCGKKRRNTIDFTTGNYMTDYGVLV